MFRSDSLFEQVRQEIVKWLQNLLNATSLVQSKEPCNSFIGMSK